VHTPVEVIDLRQRDTVPAHTFAFDRMAKVPPGRAVELLSDEAPEPLMQALAGLTHQRIDWDTIEQGPPLWRLLVRQAEEAPATSLVEMLARDHERLRRLFSQALDRVEAGDAAGARTPWNLFSLGLRRHIHAENDFVVPEMGGVHSEAVKNLLARLLVEHDQILQQLDILDHEFAHGQSDAASMASLANPLSTLLPPHEAEEEETVLPLWRVLLRRTSSERQRELLETVRRILNGSDDLVIRPAE
jgi:uncharacterized protein (DUF2249 family)